MILIVDGYDLTESSDAFQRWFVTLYESEPEEGSEEEREKGEWLHLVSVVSEDGPECFDYTEKFGPAAQPGFWGGPFLPLKLYSETLDLMSQHGWDYPEILERALSAFIEASNSSSMLDLFATIGDGKQGDGE